MTDTQRNDPRVIRGWALYDWANSAYFTTTAVALLPPYFAAVVVGEDGAMAFGHRYSAQTLWSFAASAGAFLVFLVTPILGAIADYSAAKKRLLTTFAYAGALFATSLSMVGEGDVWLTLGLFLITQAFFTSANVFYDGFLPDITTSETIDRVSAKGYAYGYLGGGLQFATSVGLLALHEQVGLTTGEAIRASMAIAGLWWFGFSVLSFRALRETGVAQPWPSGNRVTAAARIGFGRVFQTAKRIRRFPQLLLFIVSYMVYNDGVQTTFVVAAIYAKETLRLPAQSIALTILVVQLVAFVGANVFGRLSQWLGTRGALLVSLACWVGVSVGAYFLQVGASWQFFALGGAVGFVQGGTQSLSRSLYGSMIPEAASAEMFGFYSVFSKFSAIWGPLIYGVIGDVTGSGRLSILSLCAFFILGAILLALVKVDRARAARAQWDAALSPTG